MNSNGVYGHQYIFLVSVLIGAYGYIFFFLFTALSHSKTGGGPARRILFVFSLSTQVREDQALGQVCVRSSNSGKRSKTKAKGAKLKRAAMHLREIITFSVAIQPPLYVYV